ncbi:MAG: tetratricopeptide repeat protein [Myxococcaceae bacterium]
MLDPALSQVGDHARRVSIREGRLAHATTTTEKARLSSEIRAIYERDMQQPDRAFLATLKAFGENLDRATLQPELERLARVTGSFEELAEIYEAAAGELMPGDDQTVPLLRRSAELREQLGETEEAIRLWKELLSESAQDKQALDALSALYEKSQNAKSLSEVYAKKAQLAQDPTERLDLFLKAGAAYEAAGEETHAIDAFKSALAIEKNVTALEALDRLYGHSKQAEEQTDVLAQLAALTAEPQAKRQYLTRRAALFEKSNDAPHAVAAYAQVLELLAQDPAAVAGLERLLSVEAVRVDVAKLLEPIYRSQNDHKKLVDVLDVLVQVVPQGGKRISVLNEIATLREATGQKSQAFAARLRAFNEEPERTESRDELERLAAETGSFEELVGAYEDQLERGGSTDLELELWRRLAAVYGERLENPEMAAKAWEQVAMRSGSDLTVLDQLARIHRKTKNFRSLAEVMRRQVRIEPNERNKVNNLFELAHLAEESLSDKPLAAQCYQDILAIKPGDANAIKSLGRVLQETEQYPELAELIATEIALADQSGAKEETFELMIRLGRLKFLRLNDPRGALTQYQAVLQKRPGHAGAIGAIEELARSDSPLRGEAAEILEPIFNTGGDHLKLIQMLESRASAETVPAERASLLRKVAHIYAGPMENAASAFIAATKALRELPDDEAALHLCLQYVAAAEAEDELAMLLEEVTERASDDKARANLHKALARLKQQAGEGEEALTHWKKVIELSPSDPDALEAVSRLYAESGKAAELLEVLRRQLAMAEEPQRRVALLFQMGSLQNDALKDSLGALATFRRLLELKPNDPAALEKMDDLCVKQERWPELADVLARRIQITNDSTAPGAAQMVLELKYRLGQVRETRLLDRFGALDLYTEILNAQPNHAGATARLEAICQKEPQNQLAVEVLLRAYRASGEIGKLAMLIDARVAVSTEPFERKTLLLELARLRDGQDEPELGYLALYRAFKEDPNDPDLRRKLEGAADAAKAYDELAAAYEEELPRIAEAADAAEVCLKLGALLDQRVDEPTRAVVFYEKARQLDPAVWSRALPALDRLYNKLSKPAELASVLEALAALTQDATEKVGLLFRLGQLAQEGLDSPDRAATAYEKILELDKKHIAAARLLEAIYEHAGAQNKLYGVLKLQQELVTGPERERVMAKMAQISAESLDDVEHSIEIYKELLAKNPRNDNAFNALEGLLEKGKKYDELRTLLSNKIGQTLDPRELVRLNDRLGRVIHKLQGKAEEAIPYFKAALERDARHRTALESLRDIYEQLGKKDDLVIVLRRLIPLQEGAEGVKAQRIRLAEVLAEMGRREEALDSARRALEVEPHQPAELNRIHQVFLSLKAMTDAVRALELRADAELKADDKETAVDTLFEVAEFWRTIAAKPENAGPVLMRILELDAANRTAYEQATQLFSKINDWRSYAIVLEKYLPNLVTDDEKMQALRELARTQETKLGQKNLAFMANCRALQLNPAADGVREEVERLAEETGSYEELAAVYEEVADSVPRGPLAERLYLTLSRVQDQKLDEPATAEASLRKVLEFDPTNLNALDQLAGMFSRRGRNKEYVVALEQKLEAAGSIEARKQILVEIARVFDERLTDPNEAATALLRALELEPDRDTLNVLIALYRRQQQYQNVATTLMRARDLASTPEERAALQVEVAQLYERDLNDDESAVQGYAQALEFDPSNREALASLERLYTKLDRPAELLEVYQRQLELTPDYRERVKILFKCAAIWEDKYQNLANADAYIEGVLAVDPQNLQAIKTLERLRRSQERYEELVQVMERHSSLLVNPAEQSELLVEMGDVYHQQLHLVDRAVSVYHQALEQNPKSRPAMHALGTLYERSGNWPFALDMLAREAQAAGSTPEAVELYYRAGKINEDMLLDPGSAKNCYEQALRIDPGYLPCIRALKGIHEIEKDWGSFERTLIQEAQQTEDPEAKARAMLEVAKYFAETREDRDAALPWYEDAIRLVPDLVDAARPLADIYIAKENWDKGEKMLDIVVRKMAEKAVAEQDEQLARDLCRQLYRLGYVTEKLGKKDKALGAYEKAYGLDATYLPALEGLGNLLVQAKRYDDALKVLQTILIHHREELTDLEIVEIYWSIGDVYVQSKQLDKAQNHFEKALTIDQGHEPSLRSLVALADQAQRWEKSAEYRQNLSNVLDGDEKFKTLIALGMIAKDKLSDAYMAIDAYAGALKIHEGSLEVMDALYVLYRETRQGQKASEILEKMLSTNELRADQNRLKRVWFALGEISRDELKEYDRAAMAFNAALDADYRFLEAFSALEAMLGQTRQWKLLEENYARMIQRLPKGDETHAARMTLWKALGDLYLNVLKHPDGALMAYQVVSTGMPDNAEIQLQFAELAAQKPGEEEKAVAAFRRALPNTDKPGKVASALAEIAARQKDYDTAWLAAQVSSGLIGDPGPGEKEILAKLTPYAKKKEVAQKPLTDRLWQSHLFHPKIRGPLGELMAILYEQVGHLYAVSLDKYGLNPKRHRIDVATAQEYQIHHFRYVARLLGMENTELFSPFLVATRERLAKRTTEPAPEPGVNAELVQSHPAALKIGGKFFSESGQKEVYYLLGRTLALLRPELALSQRLPSERLEAVMQAAISLVRSNFRPTADPRAIDAERKLLERALPEPGRQALARVAFEYLKVATPTDIKNYIEGAELTAVRAGLFVAGEIDPVKKMVMGEQSTANRVPSRSKIRDLMVFALSEDLHALRVAVGTHVEVVRK